MEQKQRITKKKIADLFHSFQEGSKLSEKCMQRNYEHMTKDEWLALRKSQNKQLSQCYERNAELIRTVWNPIFDQPEQLSDELYDCLCDCLRDMFDQGYDDAYTVYEIASLLVKHYESRQEEIDRFIFSLKACAVGALEMSRMEDHRRGRESVELFCRIVDFRFQLHEMKEDSSRIAVFGAYTNLLRAENSLRNMTTRKTYELWQQYLEYRSQPYSHQYDEEIPRIAQLCGFLERDFRCCIAGDYYRSMLCKDGTLSRKFEQEFFDELAQISGPYLQSLMGEHGPRNRTWFYYYFNYEELLALEGKQTWRDTFYHMRDYLREHREDIKHFEEAEDVVSAISNPCFHLVEALYRSDLSPEEKSEYALAYGDLFIRLAKHINSMEYSYSINMELADFCFNHSLLACIQSDEKKEQLLFELFMARHPATYMHSVMVQNITGMILDVVLEQNPEYLIGLFGTRNMQEVLEHREDICRFGAHATLYHDIGKNRIIDIVVTEHRMINKREIAAIRRHPYLGVELLSADPSFYLYRDIALGHHRFFDGIGGYPTSFENLKSANKPMIDLITICDCMDAATDYISRNFQKTKSLEQVIKELQKDAGTRYHPGYVRILSEDRELFERLEQLVSHERENIYYEIFRQCQMMDDAWDEM